MNELNKNIFNEEITLEPNFISTKKEEIEEPKEERLLNINNNNIENNKDEFSDSSFSKYNSEELKVNKTLITKKKKKNEKYDINNKQIFFNIFEMRKKLKGIEDHFVDFKRSLVNHFKMIKK